MKKLVIIAALLMAVAGVKAQDCEALVLPYFGGDMESMEYYKSVAPEKFNLRCGFARAAFYVSDTVPAGMQVRSISEVVEKASGNHLLNDIVIDMNTFSYYAYNFDAFSSIKSGVCFSTPGSTHPFLILRSYNEITAIAEREINQPQTR